MGFVIIRVLFAFLGLGRFHWFLHSMMKKSWAFGSIRSLVFGES